MAGDVDADYVDPQSREFLNWLTKMEWKWNIQSLKSRPLSFSLLTKDFEVFQFAVVIIPESSSDFQ